MLREKFWLEFMSDLFHLNRLPIKKRQNHIKARSKNMFCSESNGSQGWLPLQVKFETKAQILAMRLAIARLLATLLRLGMFFLIYVIFYVIYLFVQATKLSLNVSSGKFLPINTKVDLRSVSFQSRPREISKLI